MHRILIGCVFAGATMAQAIDSSPIDAAVRAVREARDRGLFVEAAARREAARKLLESLPSGTDRYPDWVCRVAELYSNAGRTAEARSLLLHALELQPHSVELQLALAHSWEDDGNPVRAAAAMEKEARELLELIHFVPADESSEPVSQPQAEPALRTARDSVRAGNMEEAFVLALGAINDAPPNDETVFSEIPLIASVLAARQARGMADQLWDRLLALAESRSPDTLLLLLHVIREHARFLAAWPDRTPSARIALARYRGLLITAHGAGSGELATVLRMTIEFEQDHDAPGQAAAAAEELLGLAAVLNGPEGLGNLSALQTAAGLYEMQGNRPRVRALYQRAIAIADAGYPANDSRPAGVRVQAAFALAHQGDFDEAERLAREAAALDSDFADDLVQILDLCPRHLY